MNRVFDNIIKFYKKIKQLLVLGKCCEEIQLYQWKLFIEREEYWFLFWLKVSLLFIQEELWYMVDGVREVGNMIGIIEINLD